MRVRTALAALVLVGACGTVAGCSGGDAASGGGPSAAGSSPSRTAEPQVSVDITLENGTVDPSGARVDARVGEPVRLVIDADSAGELHVHSTPEQEIEFPAGRSVRRLTIDTPGIVDVEDHALDQVIVQLEVS